MTCKTTKNSYKMSSVMKPGPNVSIELLKLISKQKAHKTCYKQGSKLHYLGTNHCLPHFISAISVHACEYKSINSSMNSSTQIFNSVNLTYIHYIEEIIT